MHAHHPFPPRASLSRPTRRPLCTCAHRTRQTKNSAGRLPAPRAGAAEAGAGAHPPAGVGARDEAQPRGAHGAAAALCARDEVRA